MNIFTVDVLKNILNQSKIESLTLELQSKNHLWSKWNASAIEGFVNLFTKAQKLQIILDISNATEPQDDNDNTLIRFEKLPCLNEITVEFSKPHYLSSRFSHKCLKSLTTHQSTFENWRKIVQNNPNLVDVKIRDSPFNEIIPMLTKVLKLESLKIIQPFFERCKFDRPTLNAIVENCPNLKSISIHYILFNLKDEIFFKNCLKERNISLSCIH